MLDRKQRKNPHCSKAFVSLLLKLQFIHYKWKNQHTSSAFNPVLQDYTESICRVLSFTFILYLSWSEDSILLISLCWPNFFRFLVPISFFSTFHLVSITVMHTQLAVKTCKLQAPTTCGRRFTKG